ncbi:NLR family CARD domain-containing protein 3-like [Acropora muricata]|uniref:NLR family CARD domain-containing protein 3-like n=1 Tax=Acropora muricata TaxID=159855 RepID=UPI0034E5CB0C
MDSGALAFADALERNSTLTRFDLASSGIRDLGTEAICKALLSTHVMTHLSLHGSTIGDSGAEALAGELQSPATQSSYVNLAGCKITSLGVEALAGALQTNRSLTYLSLSASAIGDPGAIALAEALKSPTTQLSYLHLGWGHITSLGVKILAVALQTNRSLTHLSLERSSISCSATALAEALQLNRTLTHLDLSNNEISDTEAIQLAQTLLDKNNTLVYLDLSGNNIGAEGRAKLKLVNGKRSVIRF